MALVLMFLCNQFYASHGRGFLLGATIPNFNAMNSTVPSNLRLSTEPGCEHTAIAESKKKCKQQRGKTYKHEQYELVHPIAISPPHRAPVYGELSCPQMTDDDPRTPFSIGILSFKKVGFLYI